MPSVMNANGTMQSVSPDVGSAPGSLCGQSEVLKQVLGVIEKKARNMEKKKVNPINIQFFGLLLDHRMYLRLCMQGLK